MKCIKDEIPFEVPEGWAWARLKHVCMMAAGKSKQTNQIKAEPFEGCYPCLGGNGIRGYVDEYNHLNIQYRRPSRCFCVAMSKLLQANSMLPNMLWS